MGTAESGRWHSSRERVPNDSQLERIAQLASIDRAFHVGVADARSASSALAATERGEAIQSAHQPSMTRRAVRRLLRMFPRLGHTASGGVRVVRRIFRRLSWRVTPWRIPAPVSRGGARVVVLTPTASAREANRLLEGLGDNDLIVLVRPGARVFQSTSAVFLDASQAHPEAALFYADSFTATGARCYRPAPSRLLLEQADWLGPAIAVRASAIRQLGGFPEVQPENRILAVALGVPESDWRLAPIPIGVAQLSAQLSADAAAEARELVRSRLGAEFIVEPMVFGQRSVRRVLDAQAKVSIIIPTRGTAGDVHGESRVFVTEAVRSIVELSSYTNYEVVVVADDPTPQSVITELETLLGERLRLVRWSAPFNFSEKMNLGAALATGDLLLMLNDDVELATPDWLNSMVELASRDGVGAVGALLFFEDLTLQHAGHLYRGGAGHVGFGRPFTPKDPNTIYHLDREVSGVTGACLLLPAGLFWRVGGFSADFPGNYNDVDLCLKIRSLGLCIVCSGSARLFHFESKSRDATVRPEDLRQLQRRWSAEMTTDPFARDPRA